MFISPTELLIVGGLAGLLLVVLAPAGLGALVAWRSRRAPEREDAVDPEGEASRAPEQHADEEER